MGMRDSLGDMSSDLDSMADDLARIASALEELNATFFAMADAASLVVERFKGLTRWLW